MKKNQYLISILVLVSIALFLSQLSSNTGNNIKEVSLWTETDLGENNLQIYDSEDFKFLYPTNATLDLSEDNIIYINGPGDVPNNSINSYTFYIEIYDNPENLSAEQWATERNIKKWQGAIENEDPIGGIPVYEGKMVKNRISNVKLSGEEGFKINYYAFDSSRIAYYISKNGKIYELSYQDYPVGNSPTAPYNNDVYSFILNSFIFK